MIEAYVFFAAFTVQILAMSVLLPAWFIRHLRVEVMRLPAERFAQLFPGVDRGLSVESFPTHYRALNTVIVVLGLLLLGGLFSYLRRPDWDDGPVEILLTVYFLGADAAAWSRCEDRSPVQQGAQARVAGEQADSPP